MRSDTWYLSSWEAECLQVREQAEMAWRRWRMRPGLATPRTPAAPVTRRCSPPTSRWRILSRSWILSSDNCEASYHLITLLYPIILSLCCNLSSYPCALSYHLITVLYLIILPMYCILSCYHVIRMLTPVTGHLTASSLCWWAASLSARLSGCSGRRSGCPGRTQSPAQVMSFYSFPLQSIITEDYLENIS